MTCTIKSNTINEGNIRIDTILWTLERFNYVLERRFLEEFRIENKTYPGQFNNNFKLKIQFFGRNNDIIEIYYSCPKSVFVKSTLAISRRGCPECTLVTYEYQKIESNKWQYLSTLYKRDILGPGLQDMLLLENGSLRLLFTFHINNDVPESLPERELCIDFQNLLDSEDFADATITSVQGKEFKVHKAVLASRSKILKAHFEHNTLECQTNNIETVFETDVLKEVLTFVYSAKSPRVDDMPEKLLAAAEFYQLDALKSLCEQALQEKLTVDNAIETLELAELHSAKTLKKWTLEFIKDGNTNLITRTEGWAKIKSIDLIKSIYEYVLDVNDKAVEKEDKS